MLYLSAFQWKHTKTDLNFSDVTHRDIWRHTNISGSAVMGSSHAVSRLPANNTLITFPVFTCVYLRVCVLQHGTPLGEKSGGCRLIAEHECLWSCPSSSAGRSKKGEKVNRKRTRGSSPSSTWSDLIICQAFVHLMTRYFTS